MCNITINNKEYTVENNINLLDYLRDSLDLTGTKNG